MNDIVRTFPTAEQQIKRNGETEMTEQNKGFHLRIVQEGKDLELNSNQFTESQIDRILETIVFPSFSTLAERKVSFEVPKIKDDKMLFADLKPGEVKEAYAYTGKGKSQLNTNGVVDPQYIPNIMDAQKVPTEVKDEAKRLWNERELQKGYEETSAGVNPERTEYNEGKREEFVGRPRKVQLQGNHGTSSMADLLGEKKLADLTSSVGLSPKQYENKGPEITGEKSFGDIKEKDQTEDFRRTGVKHKGDSLHFRCGYTCPKCGNSGRHYIRPETDNVSCHHCQTPLEVEPATLKGFGTTDEYRDEEGNFTIATSINMKKYDKLLSIGRINTSLHK